MREPPPRPFLKWSGGKRQLLPELLWAVRGAGRFRRYHEPFLGGGALYFALARAGRLRGRAFLADVNPNLMDAYLGVRDEVEEVIRHLKRHRRRHGEEYFYALRTAVPRTLAARAARIIYLNRTCYNGLYRENSKGVFNTPFGRYKNPVICDEENLRAVSRVLEHADLGARPFTAVLDTAERGDLVYFDPPYVPMSRTAHFTEYSPGGFGPGDQERLAETFAELARRGVKVLLSNSLTEFTRERYAGFDIYQVMARRSINSRSDRRGAVGEALVASFPVRGGHGAEGGRRAARAVLVNEAPARVERVRARRWLCENGYPDVAELIDEVTAEWKAAGKLTRRNWWEVLAGGPAGGPRVVAGREFPVLRAAQIRQGLPVTANALRRRPGEEPPPVRAVDRHTDEALGSG